jgi:hypothetical protein
VRPAASGRAAEAAPGGRAGPDRPYDSVVTMRDELENGDSGSGRPPAVPPWAPPGPRAPESTLPDRAFAGQAAGPDYSGGPPPPRTPYLPRATGRPRGRARRLLLVIGLTAGLAGLLLSAGAAAIQFLPRNFSQAQRQQIMAWEIAKRWRDWPAGRIFPSSIGYAMPASAFGGGRSLALSAERVGIAKQASCQDSTSHGSAGTLLTKHGCVAVLRATYQDTTQTFAVTVGVAVMPVSSASSAAKALNPGGPPLVRAVSFRRTTTAHFAGPGKKVGWSRARGPYLVLATVGYADGRPWLQQGNDTYTRTEMRSLATGVIKSVASRLGAPPPVPHCPGSPGC